MKKIKHKIILIFLTVSLAFLIIIGSYSLFSIKKMNKKQSKTLELTMFEEYDTMIKNEVETAVKVVEYYYSLFENGKISENEAKEEAEALIKTLRYRGDGYFWIDDTDGNLIAHPISPQNEGKNRISLKDPNGTELIKEIISAAKNSKHSGYTDFMWEKPENVNTGILSVKRVYSSLFQPWSWIISTGNYVDDIENILIVKKNELHKEYKSIRLSIIIIIAISSIAAALVGIVIGNLISQPITQLVKAFEKDENGQITIQEIDIKSKDEIGLLSKTLNVMMSQIREFIEGVIVESKNVSESAIHVKNDSSVLSGQIAEISKSTEKIVTGLEETTVISQNMSERSEEILQASEIMAEKSQSAASSIKQISEHSEKQKIEFNLTVENGNKIIESIQDKLSQAMEDAKSVEQIKELAEIIVEITEKTNLLALNAAIESARAGEAGRGFGVVAEEIRKLADDSKSTVTKIQDVISLITSSVDSLFQNSNDLLDFITKNVKKDYNTMLSAADEFSNESKYLEGIIDDFKNSAMNFKTTMEEMTEAISQIADLNLEGAEGANSISKSIETSTDESNQLLLLAEDSNKYSENLLNLVGKFKV